MRLTSTVLAAAALAVALPAAAAPYADDFRLLTHNVYMLSTALYPNWGQNQRANLIAQATYIKGNDVVILNEVFDNTASATLLTGLSSQYPYQTPVLGRDRNGWSATLGSFSDTTPEDGGVAIVSKWPIEEQVQFIYADACGADALSNKGFVYVRVNKNGQHYHVIGTHAQSQDSACSSGQAETVRARQFGNIRDFLASKGIPASEVVFIGGDLNVIRNTSEYASMLANLAVSTPTSYAGVDYSWDPQNNGVANTNYPAAGREYLDYIFVSRNHAQPSYWHNQAQDVQSPRWEVTANGARYQYKDYSDHYPVAAFAYANASTPTQSVKPLDNRYKDVVIESVANGKAIKAGSSATAYVTATSTSADSGAHWSLRNWYYPITGCVQSGDFVELESRKYPGYWWNWYLNPFSGGNYAYYPKQDDSSNNLRLVNLSRAADQCLQDGDTVAFLDKDTASGNDYYLKRWPSGSWANYVYLWSGSAGTDEKFRVRVQSTPVYKDFRPYLRY